MENLNEVMWHQPAIRSSDTLIYLYIPNSVCNDCMTSNYDALAKECEIKGFSVSVLCPKETFRENKMLELSS